jgi:hypothetical protein
MSGWVDIINLTIGLVASDVNTGIAIGGLQAEALAINQKIDFQVEGIYNAISVIQAGDLAADVESLNEYREIITNFYNYSQGEANITNAYNNIRSLMQTRNASYLTRIQTGLTNFMTQNPLTTFITGTGGVVLGIIYGIAQGISFNGYLNSLTKSSVENSNLTSTEKQTLKAYITEKQMLLIATTGKTRNPTTPNTPTVGEGLGQPNFAVYSWQGVFAPAGIPKAVLSRLNTAVNNSLKSPALSKLLADQGMESRPSTPEAMQEFIAKEKVSMGDSVKIMKNEKAR